MSYATGHVDDGARVCVIDSRRALKDYQAQVCTPCESYLGRLLDELDRTWPLLHQRSKLVGARRSAGVLVGGSREQPIPIDVDHLDLTGAARAESLYADGEDRIGYLSVATELDAWARDWAAYLDQRSPIASVQGIARWLRERLAWACSDHPAIDEFATDLKRITATVRRRADEVDDRLVVGHCPAVIDDMQCGATLRADAWLDVIECPRCTTRWQRSSWLILAQSTRQEAA